MSSMGAQPSERIAIEATIIHELYPYLPQPSVYRYEGIARAATVAIGWFRARARRQPLHDVQPIYVPELQAAASTIYRARDVEVALRIIRRGPDSGGLRLRAEKLPADVKVVFGQIVPLNTDPQGWPILEWDTRELRQGVIVSRDVIGFDLSRVAWGARFGVRR